VDIHDPYPVDPDGTDARKAAAEERGWTFHVWDQEPRLPTTTIGDPRLADSMKARFPNVDLSTIYTAEATVDGAPVPGMNAWSLPALLDRVEEFDRQHGRL
jgi:hypothetical protein